MDEAINPPPTDRRVELSVGRLAGFLSLPLHGTDASGIWRAQLGNHWHSILREHQAATGEGWAFEVALAGRLLHRGWEFQLKGRVDQWLAAPSGNRLIEVKTVDCPLPIDPVQARARWPQYFHQACLYAFLAAEHGGWPAAELLLVEIQTGLTQRLPIGDEDAVHLRQHLDNVVDHLSEAAEHAAALQRLQVPPAFAQWRPGQAEARNDLIAALQAGPFVHMEAPTGFGKTAIALEQALQALASGNQNRILLLTGKNTGHLPLLGQLRTLRASQPFLRAYALRSRKDHDSADAAGNVDLPAEEIARRWQQQGLRAPELLEQGISTLDDTLRLAATTGIPAWFISKLLLDAADIWIADYNYLFAPGAAQLLPSLPSFDPARTFLIVDEAHNLPERVRASYSWQLQADRIRSVLTEVQFARFPGRLARLLDSFLACLLRLQPCEELDPPIEVDIIGYLRELAESWHATTTAWDELSSESRDWLWQLDTILQAWDDPRLPYHVYAPTRGCIVFDCTNAAAVTADTLRGFAKCLFLSATLRPWPHWQQAIGLPVPDNSRILASAAWLQQSFEVWIDARVDTRFSVRQRHYETTARTIGETASQASGCVIVFFPSYQYAQAILDRLVFNFPLLRCTLQPRTVTAGAEAGYLDSALCSFDVLFLILGSRFSEAIDTLGGRVHEVIVVSPALPEVNARQRARERSAQGSRSERFDQVYLLPGMRKIIQALGRMVRDPQHRARVLLHDRRFSEPAYRDRLPDYLQPRGVLREEEDFTLHWLRR